MHHITSVEFILYVRDQQASTAFYRELFRAAPDVDVPGMTEFILSKDCKLGLMPENGIARILADKAPHPGTGTGIPRCELYLYVENIQREFENAKSCGAKIISPVLERDWGDTACYFSDPDGHIIAFAKKTELEKGV